MKTLRISGRKLRATFALAAFAIAATVGVPGAAHAQSNLSLSIGINQPGVYGRVDIGNAPPPVIYEQPVIIAPPPQPIPRRPIYLRVPPGYEQNWGRYCSQYAACGQPVYFVRYDTRREPPPRYVQRRDDRRDWRHDDHRDDRRGPPGRRDDHGPDRDRR
jgi:hypothetical protein